jgi:hypothetical protein
VPAVPSVAKSAVANWPTVYGSLTPGGKPACKPQGCPLEGEGRLWAHGLRKLARRAEPVGDDQCLRGIGQRDACPGDPLVAGAAGEPCCSALCQRAARSGRTQGGLGRRYVPLAQPQIVPDQNLRSPGSARTRPERTPLDRLVKGQRGRYARRASCQRPSRSDQSWLGRMP